MSMLQQFEFGDAAIRIVLDEDETPWFIAKDVCDVLDVEKVPQAIDRLDDDERDQVIVETAGGPQSMAAVSESGLYALIFTSRKENAKSFRKWVTSEVLPALRMTGRYETPGLTPRPTDKTAKVEIDPDAATTWLGIIREYRLLRGRAAALALWESQSPLPRLPKSAALFFGAGKRADGFETADEVVDAFLRDRVKLAPGEKIGATMLYQAYAAYCGKLEIPELSMNAFGREMSRRNIDRRKAGNIAYEGLELVA